MIPETFSGISLHRWTQTFELFPDLKEKTAFFTEIPLKFGSPQEISFKLHSLKPTTCSPLTTGLASPEESKKHVLPKALFFQCFFPCCGFQLYFFRHSPGWMLVSKVKTVGGSAHGYIHCSLCRLAIAPDVSKKPIEVWLHLTNVDGNMVSGNPGKWGWSVVVGFAAFRNTSYILRLYVEIGDQVFGDFRMETWHGNRQRMHGVLQKVILPQCHLPCLRTGRHCIVFAGWSCWGLPCQRLMMYMERRWN